jgi:EAL domain-containing protein (putative c-di-GMP-specific phosphodiesterase class I)
MDDFGTGYSSLSYLRSFPFDKIKIDQSFIRGDPDDPSNMAIVRAIAALGRALGMTTTAEGVETQEQLARVTADGCTDAQGYLISKPLAPELIGEFLQSRAIGVGMAGPAAA